MSVIEKLTKPAHLIDMNDIIREGNPTLRAVAKDVTFPLTEQEVILGEKMLQFLRNSQDPVMAEKMGLRGGVGLAAPQLDLSKRIIAVLVPNLPDKEGNPPKEAYALQTVMYNAKVVAHSVQDAALAEGRAACQLTAKCLVMSCAMHASLLNILTKKVKNTVSDSKDTTQSWFNTRLTTPTASCSMTASMKKNPSQSKTVC